VLQPLRRPGGCAGVARRRAAPGHAHGARLKRKLRLGEAGGSLGGVIRGARDEHALTLQQVAHRTRLSVSYLSQIERNLLHPSVSTLKNIAQALGIPAGKLMFPATTSPKRALVSVQRKGERKRIVFPHSNIEYQLLTPDLRRRVSMLWLTAQPGAESGPAFTHEGEDGVVVLKGKLSMEIGGVWHELKSGDSIYFSSALPHRWRNPGRVLAEAIWMSAPPSF
jgi:transcriptional regulator with XRE-family HTH domain